MTDVFSIPQRNGFYNPPCALEQPALALSLEYAEYSPKSTAVPPVAIL